VNTVAFEEISANILTTFSRFLLNFNHTAHGGDSCLETAKNIHSQKPINWATERKRVSYHGNSTEFFAQCAQASNRDLRSNDVTASGRYSLVLFALGWADADGFQNFYREDRIGGTCVDE